MKRKNIAEAVELFIESCLILGTLREVLKDKCFQLVQQKNERKKPHKIDARAKWVNFPVNIPLASGR